MASRFEQMLFDYSNSFFRMRYNRYFLNELRNIEKHSEIKLKKLSNQQNKEIKDYYESKGFRNIRKDWHRYILSSTGRWSPQMVPENFYHNILERIYNDKRLIGWGDKSYMTTFLPGVQFPTTLITNVNGYFLDANREIISEKKAKSIILDEGKAFAKPSRESGGGRNAFLIDSENIDQVFLDLKKNFIVQKIIKQHSEMAAFNPSSVNTEKILSFLFKGEVFVISSLMRVGSEDSIIDNACGGKGYTLGIRPDGSIEPVGMNVFGKKRNIDYYGNPFAGRKLTCHKEICEIIKSAHKLLPYFGFVSWDFCVTDKGAPLLIEYNTSNADVLIFQMANGPLFGDMYDEVLKDARKYSDSIRYVK